MTRSADPAGTARTRSPLFGVITGLLALDVLLQGLWAGIFLEHDGQRDRAHGWIAAHNAGGALAVALAVVAVVVAHVQFSNRALTVPSGVLAVLLIAEYGIGQAIGGAAALTAVHVPLALAIMALATWLPVRARQVRVGRTAAGRSGTG